MAAHPLAPARDDLVVWPWKIVTRTAYLAFFGKFLNLSFDLYNLGDQFDNLYHYVKEKGNSENEVQWRELGEWPGGSGGWGKEEGAAPRG